MASITVRRATGMLLVVLVAGCQTTALQKAESIDAAYQTTVSAELDCNNRIKASPSYRQIASKVVDVFDSGPTIQSKMAISAKPTPSEIAAFNRTYDMALACRETTPRDLYEQDVRLKALESWYLSEAERIRGQFSTGQYSWGELAAADATQISQFQRAFATFWETKRAELAAEHQQDLYRRQRRADAFATAIAGIVAGAVVAEALQPKPPRPSIATAHCTTMTNVVSCTGVGY